MKSTGVFASQEEIDHLRELMKQPVMYITGGKPFGSDPVKECHRLALSHGLPEIAGFYGIKEDGEFVTV